MSYRIFSERFNQALDHIGVPLLMEERIDAVVHLFKIPRFQAGALLRGDMIPSDKLLEKLIQELEVKSEWLFGKEKH